MAGLSLIELMIAMTISSLLLIGVTSIYFNARESDKFISELSRIQESGRHALNFLAQDIRMAGYQGCMNPDPEEAYIKIRAHNPPTSDFFSTALSGFEVPSVAWAQDANIDPVTGVSRGDYFKDEDFTKEALIGSDILVVQRLTTDSAELSADMVTSDEDVVLVDNEMEFEQFDIAVIANCNNADMFRISEDPEATATITLSHGLITNSDDIFIGPYTRNARVRGFESTIYFVANTGRTTETGVPINALFRAKDKMVNKANPEFDVEELIEGIDSMQILYGELNSDPQHVTADGEVISGLRYVTADNVTDMKYVKSIQLGLLVSGSREVLTNNDDATYILPGEEIQPEGKFGSTVTYEPDRRLRREFSQTIQLRNR
ncbi:hypothetical protein A3757_21180 [Oleiphilus sp. HI0117]|nr:hypothetical protein A3757_21180 [Oleiphilus sp. HI0117]